jgi:hypothetical protein
MKSLDKCQFVDLSRVLYTVKANDSQLSFILMRPCWSRHWKKWTRWRKWSAPSQKSREMALRTGEEKAAGTENRIKR